MSRRGRWVRCTRCHGHGVVSSSHDPHVPDDCSACQGRGAFWATDKRVTLYPGGPFATVAQAQCASTDN